MKKRLYTSGVFRRDETPEGSKNYVFVKVADAENGTEAAKKAKELAESNAGKAYCACNIWPPVMTKAVTTFVYVDPDDPSKTLRNVDVDVEDDDDDDDDKTSSAVTPAAVSTPVADSRPVTAAPAVPAAPAAPATPAAPAKTVVDPAPAVTKTAVKPASKPAAKPAPKAEPAKEDAMTDLFAGTDTTKEEKEGSEDSFANEDEIDPDEEGDGGVPKGLF